MNVSRWHFVLLGGDSLPAATLTGLQACMRPFEDDQYKLYETCNVLGRDYKVLPGVFSPAVFPNTAFFARQVSDVLKESGWRSFIEIGSGSGVVSVEALYAGCFVYAVDIADASVVNTRINVPQKFTSAFSVHKSDVFSDFDPAVKADCIFFNFPFCYIDPAIHVSDFVLSVADVGYRSIEAYIAGASNFVNCDGQILVGISYQLADMVRFNMLCEQYGLTWVELKNSADEGPVQFQLLELMKIENV